MQLVDVVVVVLPVVLLLLLLLLLLPTARPPLWLTPHMHRAAYAASSTVSSRTWPLCACKHVCASVCVYVCVYVSVCVCMCIRAYVHLSIEPCRQQLHYGSAFYFIEIITPTLITAHPNPHTN